MEEKKTIQAEIVTADGKKIVLDLFPNIAPLSVQNFVRLADSGFYDGTCFHRIIDGFMIQGGGLMQENGRLIPKEGAKTIQGEFAENGVPNALSPGVISMARTPDPDSASSQFFICVADATFLDGKYAAFGKTHDEESLQNAIALGKVRTGRLGYYEDVPLSPVVIRQIRIVR